MKPGTLLAAAFAGAVAVALFRETLAPAIPPVTDDPPLPDPAIPVGSVTPEMTAWAVALLQDPAFTVGRRALRQFGDAAVVAQAEVHTWFGEDPTRPSEPHKGITLYEAS